jgi:predicted MFS family arabinose efflux permease
VVTSGLPSALPIVSAARRTMLGSIGDGLLVIRRNRFLLGVFILAVVPTMFVMPYSNLLPVFARDVFDIGSLGLGLMMAANGLGGVVGALLVAGSRWINSRPGVLVWTATGFALAVLAFAVTPSATPAVILIFTAGLISAVYMAVNNTQIQLNVDDSVRGRVLSVYLFTWGLLPLGVLPAGIIAGRSGAPAAIFVMTLLGLVLILFTAARFPSLRAAGALAPVPSGTDPQRV